MKKQRGASLLELIAVLAIFGFISVMGAEQAAKKADEHEARNLGMELFAVHNAARKFAAINAANPNLHTGAGITTETGLDWLKSATDCGGTANSNYLNCNQQNTTRIGNFIYNTEIDGSSDANTVKIKTVLNTKDAGGNTLLPSNLLGQAAITASGGAMSTSVDIAGMSAAISDPAMSNTSSFIIYCPIGIAVGILNPECTDVGSATREGGLIVMITESSSSSAAWLFTNGGNAMHASLDFDSADEEFREIIGVDRVYNLAGEILKIGNSGIYYDSGAFAPILGDGLVIDTDIYAVGDVRTLGDVDIKGDILTEGSAFVDGMVYAGGQITTEDDLEVWGDQYILGEAIINGDATVFGTMTAEKIRSSTFLEAQEISATGGIYAGQLVNAPVIRASVDLISEGDLSVDGDSIIGGDEYISGDSVVQGSIFTDSDLIADTGTAYLNNVFASAVYDNDGAYVLDPSGTSRLNVMRADQLAPSTSGSELRLNANEFLFTAEDNACTSASDTCATTLEGYFDMENLYVKDVDNGQWVRLVDWIASSVTSNDDDSTDTGTDTGTGSDSGPAGCWYDNQNGGIWNEGTFHAGWTECP